MSNKNIYRISLLAAALSPVGIAYAGVAAEQKLSISGTLDTQYGLVHQKNDFRYKIPADTTSGRLARGSIVNKTRLKFDWDAVAENGLKYGASIKLRTDTYEKNGRIGDKVFGYIEGDFGKVQVGSHVGASISMRQSAAEIAKASGGIDGEVSKWFHRSVNEKASDNINITDPEEKYFPLDSAFIADPAMPIGSVQKIDAVKVTYFTPEFAGLQFGVSYTPDVEILGTVAKASKVTDYVGKGDGFSFKDVVEGGLQYTYNVGGAKVTSALLGQFGEAKQPDPNDDTTGNFHVQPLRAWEISSKVEYNDWAVAGSYGDWGKSATPKKRVDGCKYGGQYWTAGVAYKLNDFAASLTYFGSRRAGGVYKGDALEDKKYNNLSLISLGVEYQLVPGLLPYVEMNWFKHNDNNTTTPSNSGTVLLVGSKLSF